MAQTNLIATTLSVGQESSASIAETRERIALEISATQVGTADSLIRLIVKDAEGHVKAHANLAGTKVEELVVERISSALTVLVECLSGQATVNLDQITGYEATFDDKTQTATADLADDSVTNAKIGPAAVDTTELAAGASTLPKQDWAAVKPLVAAGVAAAGPVTLTGAVVGDRVMLVLGTVTAGTGPMLNDASDFEAIISVVDEIQQTLAGDLSGNTYMFILIPAQA